MAAAVPWHLLRASMLASVLIAASASAVTLTITPDKSTYLVGETITLSVHGDAQGAADNRIFGRLLFDSGLAMYVGSSQGTLTSFGGVPWIGGVLDGGAGFADAFNQVAPLDYSVPDAPLSAEVVLQALGPGPLTYSWLADRSGLNLDFFGLIDAPGGSVSIVPEPSTLLLVGMGLLLLRRVARPH